MTERIVVKGTTRATGAGMVLTATAQLVLHGENDRPYFSLTGELATSGGTVRCCGRMGPDLVKVWPALAAVERVHLADDRGVPMHAEANALYWGGFSTWPGGKEWRQMVPDDDYGRRTLETDDGLIWAPETFAHHLRVTVEEGRRLRAYVRDDPTEHYSAAMHFLCQSLRGQWQQDADAALAVIHNMPAPRRAVASLATI